MTENEDVKQFIVDVVGSYLNNSDIDDRYEVFIAGENDNIDKVFVDEYGDTGYEDEHGVPVLKIINSYEVEINIKKKDS